GAKSSRELACVHDRQLKFESKIFSLESKRRILLNEEIRFKFKTITHRNAHSMRKQNSKTHESSQLQLYQLLSRLSARFASLPHPAEEDDGGTDHQHHSHSDEDDPDGDSYQRKPHQSITKRNKRQRKTSSTRTQIALTGQPHSIAE
ncbi:hypothetical protein PMAYCL1PPCAC_11085, partial [Pristionchus mayeri]